MDLENLYRNAFTTTTSSVVNGITAWNSVRSATNEAYNAFNNYVDSGGTIRWNNYTFPSRRLVIDDLAYDDIYEVNDRYRIYEVNDRYRVDTTILSDFLGVEGTSPDSERTHLNNESEDIYKITKKDIDDLLS